MVKWEDRESIYRLGEVGGIKARFLIGQVKIGTKSFATEGAMNIRSKVTQLISLSNSKIHLLTLLCAQPVIFFVSQARFIFLIAHETWIDRRFRHTLDGWLTFH